MSDEQADRGGWEPPAFSAGDVGTAARAERNAAPILVVDDKEAVRTSVAQVLRTVGYTVIESGDGVDALRLLSTMRFEAMVLDLRMPRLDGPGLLASLPKPPPTIVLSATKLDDDVRARAGSAIVAELTKPVAPQRLIDAVAAAVTQSAD